MQNGVIYGIDIAKGSSRAREEPRYAVAVLDKGEVTHYSLLRRHRILRMVQKDRPGCIAVDNIYELAADKKDLINFLQRLPEGTKLVQVTGGIHQRPLTRLAREHNFTFNQLNPNEEAEACARLAGLGVGCEVSLFEDMTKIKVSRARSLGRGGWSQNRYRRKVHGGVKEKSREIESVLKKFSRETGFELTSRVTEGFGGYVRAEYTINASRDRVPVKPSSTADVQVTVKSVERDKIKYLPLGKKGRRYTIVGIDPGTTAGIAILSLEGELLFLQSIRGISHDEIVKLISEYGKPAVIATDVYPTPAAVEKIRRSFNAVLGTPGGEMRAEEKIALARPFGYSNDHERDALAAALTTYKNYKNVFSRVEKKTPKHLDMDKVKFHVIHGVSIEEAIERITPSPVVRKDVPSQSEKEEVSSVDGLVQKLREELSQKNSQIKQLREYVAELKYESSQKERTIELLEMRVRKVRNVAYLKVRKDKEIDIRDREIERLKKELGKAFKSLKKQRLQTRRIKQLHKKEIKGEGLPVKIITSFAKEAIQHTKDVYGLKKGDLVYLEDPSGGGPVTASVLVDSGVKAVLISEDMPHAALEHFYDSDIPVIRGLEMQRVDDFATVAPEALDKAISEWEEKASERRKEKEHEQFKSILDEYRSERKRGLA
ncbi:MAG: DUF460 domain-containing protein [Methanosarcinaceae archaeon]|nr:DUF460 domain-containing protein [Methanosarcinaceae archaeon]